MKSLILTILYLAKDTVNRWLSRVSSPLARVLVVFFLSLCALCFLGSYVISAKIIRDRIVREGGDLVHANIFAEAGKVLALPTAQEFERLLDVDSVVLETVGVVNLADRRSVPVYTFDFRRSAQMMPYMAPCGTPTLLCPPTAGLPPGPTDVSHPRFGSFTVMVRHLPEQEPIMRLVQHGALIVHPETAAQMRREGSNSTQHVMLRLRRLESSADLLGAEDYLRRYIRLEGVSGNVGSAARLLEEMDVVLGNQTQCRATFCLGIVAIVGILLTALAGMEYRQNEYIYTLMKSFGIHPGLLVVSFLVENAVLVGLSFAAALQVFMSCQAIIVRQFFHTDEYSLTLQEIMPEIRLIAAALGVCIAFSALPIIVAAHREIGRVLK
ncbi:MAG: hypothetical protein MJ051_05310 [Akkermansia sp.]|nr:hypothetical protein [Akkermansia sp.]